MLRTGKNDVADQFSISNVPLPLSLLVATWVSLFLTA